MGFSNRVYASFDDWAANVAPAPRCSECDSPLALGEVANSPNDEDISGPLGLPWLCVRCAVHLLDPTRAWTGRWSECGLTNDRPAPPFLGEWSMKVADLEAEATCGRCRRGRESRIHLAKYLQRYMKLRRPNISVGASFLRHENNEAPLLAIDPALNVCDILSPWR